MGNRLYRDRLICSSDGATYWRFIVFTLIFLFALLSDVIMISFVVFSSSMFVTIMSTKEAYARKLCLIDIWFWLGGWWVKAWALCVWQGLLLSEWLDTCWESTVCLLLVLHVCKHDCTESSTTVSLFDVAFIICIAIHFLLWMMSYLVLTSFVGRHRLIFHS